jgi:hypothetical protein
MSLWLKWTANDFTRGAAISIAKDVTTPTGTANRGFIQLGVTGSGTTPTSFNTQGGVYGGINDLTGNTQENVNGTGFNDGGTLVNPAIIPLNTGTALNDNQWHHVAMTIDEATDSVELFVDGVSKGGRNETGVTNDPILPFAQGLYNNFEVGRLGRSTPTAGYPGMIDDVQIYDKVLSASNIAFLFANPGSVAPLDGDFNNDGKVNAADYVLWRRHYGSPISPLANDLSPGVGDDDYAVWRQNFDNGPAGSGIGSGANVPEPNTLAGGLMLLLTTVALAARKR